MKRLALLTALTLALATPAHAGKRQKSTVADLDTWLTLVQDMGMQVDAGQLRFDNPDAIVGWAVDLAFAELGPQPKKKKKGKKKRKNKNQSSSSADGVHRVANARR